jgi:hypothetical protein
MGSLLTVLNIGEKEWLKLKQAQMQGAIASRAAGVAFGEAAVKAKESATNSAALAEASREVNEATRLAGQQVVTYGEAVRNLGPAFDAAVASSQAFAGQMSFGDFGLEAGFTELDDPFAKLMKQREIASQGIATRQQIKIDAEVDAGKIGDSIAQSVQEGLSRIQGAIGQVSGLTFSEIMPPEEVFRIDEWVRRAQAVSQDMNNEWATALQDEFGGQDFFQPVMDAFAAGDQSGVTEAIQGIITGDDIINMMDIDGAMEQAKEILAEQNLQQRINDMIMAAFAESGAALPGEGAGAGEGLLSQMLGLGAVGEEDAGLTGAFDGLAEAAGTAFGETIPGAIEPTMTALTDTDTLLLNMTETTIPGIEEQTNTTTSAMMTKLNELKATVSVTASGFVSDFKEAGGSLKAVIGQLEKVIEKVKKLAKEAKKASDALGGVGVGGGGGGGPGTDAGFQHGTPPGGFTVPPGFPNDSFRVGLTSGERLFVKPQGRSGGGGLTIGTLILNGVNDPQAMFAAIEREARARGMRFQVAT